MVYFVSHNQVNRAVSRDARQATACTPDGVATPDTQGNWQAEFHARHAAVFEKATCGHSARRPETRRFDGRYSMHCEITGTYVTGLR